MRFTALRQRKWRSLSIAIILALSAIGYTALGPVQTAKADPGCLNGGVYIVFARGSGEHLDDLRAHQFYMSLIGTSQFPGALSGSVTTAFSELGNEDGDVPVDMSKDPSNYVGVQPNAAYASPYDEYPARFPSDPGTYGSSVKIGADELVKHLNDRVSRCPNESIVLGGYSQGADVIGWTLQRSDLSQTVRNHIGFVALYGDPKFEAGPVSDRVGQVNFSSDWWWVRGNDTGFRQSGFNTVPDSGILGAHSPYVDNQFKGRFGSWCAAGDAMCAGFFPWGVDVHGNAYQGAQGWISQSASEIAYEAAAKANVLWSPPSGFPPYTPPNPSSGPPVTSNPPPPPPSTPTILQVKRSLNPDGVTHEVYAATNSTVTEGWWVPGGDGVHTDQIINIAQGNIVGFDKVNMPDGVTQSIYTAVPDGVWESWWRPGTGVTSNKIVSGLSGVRQVIVANAYEGSQFVHRLYLLASDGPYEVWWKDGGDGVHWDRLNNITGGVAMAAGTGTDGAYEVFVATPTWVYQLWWFPGGTVNYRTILNITQGDIRSLSMGVNLNGGQLLYTGTSTTAWQSWWLGDNGSISTGTIATGQSGAIQVEKDVYSGTHELYMATPGNVQEFWWNGPNSGNDTLITISQGNITGFDKSDDGNYQQVYTASGDLVYETYWGAEVNPTTDVLYSVPN